METVQLNNEIKIYTGGWTIHWCCRIRSNAVRKRYRSSRKSPAVDYAYIRVPSGALEAALFTFNPETILQSIQVPPTNLPPPPPQPTHTCEFPPEVKTYDVSSTCYWEQRGDLRKRRYVQLGLARKSGFLPQRPLECNVLLWTRSHGRLFHCSV